MTFFRSGFIRLAVALWCLGSLARVTGSASYAIATAATAHGGSIPTAGPTGAVSDSGIGGGGGMGGGPELQNGDAPPNSSDATVHPASNGLELSIGSASNSELKAMLV